MPYKEMAEELIRIRSDSFRRQSVEAMEKLTSGEMSVMNYLCTHQDTAYPKDLCQALSVSTARIAKILNVLSEKGLIRRQPDPDDSRKTVVCLMKMGRESVQKHKQEVSGYLSSILEKAGEKDASEYIRIENKLADLMKNEPYAEWKKNHRTETAEAAGEDRNGNC